MSAAARMKTRETIDSLMDQAAGALSSTEYFKCERLASEALKLAHRARDFDAMARILMPLEECRRQNRLLAADAGLAGRLSESPSDSFTPGPGCWLVEPPLVGADGRELLRRARDPGVAALLVVREPETQRGAWPIVRLGPVTIRAYVDPPADGPDAAWFLDAVESLGEAAIESVNSSAPAERRVNDLCDLLATVPDHDRLHQALADACAQAVRDAQPQ